MNLPLHSQQEAETNHPVFKAKKLCQEAGLFVSVGSSVTGKGKILRIHVDRNTPDHAKIIRTFCLINHWEIVYESPNIITARVK